MSRQLNSIFQPIIDKIYTSSSLEDGIKIMTETIESHPKIKEQDKNKMLYELKNIPSLTRLQFYATNLMFKYEGLGVNGRSIPEKKKKEVMDEWHEILERNVFNLYELKNGKEGFDNEEIFKYVTKAKSQKILDILYKPYTILYNITVQVVPLKKQYVGGTEGVHLKIDGVLYGLNGTTNTGYEELNIKLTTKLSYSEKQRAIKWWKNLWDKMRQHLTSKFYPKRKWQSLTDDEIVMLWKNYNK